MIGLGYVGLPLTLGFAQNFETIGFDINDDRVRSLTSGFDRSGDIDGELLRTTPASFTSDANRLLDANVIVVAVPTPVDAYNNPDYSLLRAASFNAGRRLGRGSVVIFESTVNPGATEDICVPELERSSGMRFNTDFFVGYSPERVSPGDRHRTVERIVKIVAGSTPEVCEFLVDLYGSFVNAGIHKVSSIRVAEMTKILENIQRDVNIAVMNEVLPICDRMGISTLEVIEAAATKWNFHHYVPGLVGGHCIAVDPYYLVQGGRRLGLPMSLLAAARAVNENMADVVVEMLDRLLQAEGVALSGARILLLGRSFKENCSDTRNSKAFRIMDLLFARRADVVSFDPVANDDQFEGGRGSRIAQSLNDIGEVDAIMIVTAHDAFRQLDFSRFRNAGQRRTPVVDIKASLRDRALPGGFVVWHP